MERIKLNLIPSGVAPVVHVSQYDDGRTFAIDLFEGDNAYTLDGTETLTVNVRKPDGHLVTESVTNTSDSYVTVDTTEQMTACHGTNLANLKIEKGSITIASLNFLMNVERDPLENGDPSESFVDNLNTQIANAVADQYDSNNVIFDNAPTSGHGTPYTVTSEGIKTTFDNLKVGDLSDVTITTPTQGEALVFDNDGNLVNGTVSTVGSIDDLSDVDTTGKAWGDNLRYNGVNWIAQKNTIAVTQAEYDAIVSKQRNTHYVITDGQDVTCNLGDLNDVDTSGASTGDILVKGASGWETSNILSNKVNIAYRSDSSVATYNVPLTDLQTASGRGYGMALVFAWKEIFAIFYNNDNTVYGVSLTSHGDRTLSSISYSSENIVLTFSGTIWGGISIIAI